MPLSVEIITAEEIVQTEENLDVLIVPGSEGQLAILPRHAPLMTTLDYGELIFRRGTNETSFAIGGGFLEVHSDKVTVLADVAENADEIDAERAEEARKRAEERLQNPNTDQTSVDLARAQASLQRALLRLNVVEKRRRRTNASSSRG
ncbi:MAG: F0F1 ATP synthase subunit epsilon [Dehalococcoidia bacterium]|nr:F0F1 ATP synthase subunit epsilon [Dehalococcoidia bacterium]